MEYDAYRVDLEELNLRPRDDTSLPKLEQAQKVFQSQRENYLKIREDLSVKVRLLEENRVSTRVLQSCRAREIVLTTVQNIPQTDLRRPTKCSDCDKIRSAAFPIFYMTEWEAFT